MTKDTIRIRLWGNAVDMPQHSRKDDRTKLAGRIARNASYVKPKVTPEQIELVNVTEEEIKALSEKRSKRGGVDGGTSRDDQSP